MTINDYCLYYDNWELRDKGKTELYICHYLLVDKMIDKSFNYKVAMILSNPENKNNIMDLKDIKPEFIKEQVLPEIEKQIQMPIEHGTKPKYKTIVDIDGNMIFTKRALQ